MWNPWCRVSLASPCKIEDRKYNYNSKVESVGKGMHANMSIEWYDEDMVWEGVQWEREEQEEWGVTEKERERERERVKGEG